MATLRRNISYPVSSAFKVISETLFRQESSKISHFSTWLRQKHRLAGVFLALNTTYMATVWTCPGQTLQCSAWKCCREIFKSPGGTSVFYPVQNISIQHFYAVLQFFPLMTEINARGPTFLLLSYHTKMMLVCASCCLSPSPSGWILYPALLVAQQAAKRKPSCLYEMRCWAANCYKSCATYSFGFSSSLLHPLLWFRLLEQH